MNSFSHEGGPSSAAVRPVERVAMYARVSSERQADEATIEGQIAALRERIAADGFSLDEERCFLDDGYSGTTLARPALEKLRDAAYLGGFQRLYVYAPDRLARKYAYQVLLIDELRRHGLEVVFLNRAIGVSPEEDLFLQMQGMFAEYERAKILERCRRGKRHKAQRGDVSVLSAAPFGYRYVPRSAGGEPGRYEMIPEHAAVVRQMFEWVGRDRLSLGEVRRRLKAQGTLSPTGKPFWNPSTVWALLKNRAFCGSAAFGKTRVGERRPVLRPRRDAAKTPRRTKSLYPTDPSEWTPIPVPAVIDEALFAAVQQQLETNRRRVRESRRSGRYLLQGLVVCGCCHYAYYGKWSRHQYAYYRCLGSDRPRFGGQSVCQNHQVRGDLLDQAVWQDVCELLRQPQLLRDEYERRLQVADKTPQREPLTRQWQQAERAVSRLIDAYQDGVLKKTEFEPRLTRARERVTRLRADLERLDAVEVERNELRRALSCLDEFAAEVGAGLDQADWTARQDIIRTLVEKVSVEPDQIRIVYRLHIPPFANSHNGRERIRQFHSRRFSAFVLIPEQSPRGAERSTASLQLRSQPLARRSGRTSALPYPPSSAGARVLLYKIPWKGRTNHGGDHRDRVPRSQAPGSARKR